MKDVENMATTRQEKGGMMREHCTHGRRCTKPEGYVGPRLGADAVHEDPGKYFTLRRHCLKQNRSLPNFQSSLNLLSTYEM